LEPNNSFVFKVACVDYESYHVQVNTTTKDNKGFTESIVIK